VSDSGVGKAKTEIEPKSRDVKGSEAVANLLEPSPHLTALTTLKKRHYDDVKKKIEQNSTHPLCGILAIYLPVVTSNRRAFASAQAVTTYLESQLGSMSQTAPP
jgi:hypothetical protein